MSESKDAKLKRVAEAMLDLIFLHGVESVTPTRLSRSANVSRSWIYKYLGGSQAALLDFAIKHFGELFAELNVPLDVSTPEAYFKDQAKSFGRLLDVTDAYPGVIVVFYQFRGRKHRMGEGIDAIATRHLAQESKEITQVFRLPEARAAQISASLTIYRLGTAHAWVMGALKKAYDKNALVAEYERICRGMLAR
jgi:hypothetical protein